jgi:hypothetical protein
MRNRGIWRMGASRGVFGAAGGLFVGVVVSLASLGVGAGPAFAVGNATVNRLIIANPVPGWVAEPGSSLSGVASDLGAHEAQSIEPQNGRALTAVQGWRDPSNPARNVIIVLVALGFQGQSAAAVDGQAKQGAIAALTSLCAGLATSSSVRASTIPQIPGSHMLTCTLIKDGTQPLAAAWTRGNVIAVVLSTQVSMNSLQLTLIAGTQYLAMPAHGVPVPISGGGSSSSTTAIELAIGAVVLLGAGYALFQILRRGEHAAKKVPAPEPVPEVRRGVVQRPASLAGGVGPPADLVAPARARPPGSAGSGPGRERGRGPESD